MNGELKACPFCGAREADSVRGPYVHATGQAFVVCCPNCGASSDYFSRTGTAIEAWNRRPTPAPGALPELPEPFGWYRAWLPNGESVDEFIPGASKPDDWLDADCVPLLNPKAVRAYARELDREQFANNRQAPGECPSCEPDGVYATDGSGPLDCYTCGKKAAPQPPAQEQGEALPVIADYTPVSPEEEAEIDAALGLVKVRMRVPADLHRELVAESEARGLVLAAVIRERLTRAAGAEDARDTVAVIRTGSNMAGMRGNYVKLTVAGARLPKGREYELVVREAAIASQAQEWEK